MSEPIRVLYVDDNEDLRRLMGRILGTEADVVCAGTLGSADSVVSEAGRLGVHVVLMDLTMDGKEPLEAIAELAAVHPDVRTIAFSGRDDPETRDAAFRAGAFELVSKQGDTREILTAIRRVARLA